MPRVTGQRICAKVLLARGIALDLRHTAYAMMCQTSVKGEAGEPGARRLELMEAVIQRQQPVHPRLLQTGRAANMHRTFRAYRVHTAMKAHRGHQRSA